MNRRSFLKRASGVIAAISAPLFIPSDRLDFGVPRARIIVPEPLTPAAIGRWFDDESAALKIIGGQVNPITPYVVSDSRLLRFESMTGYPQQYKNAVLQTSADGRTWTDVVPGERLHAGRDLRMRAMAASSARPFSMSFSVAKV